MALKENSYPISDENFDPFEVLEEAITGLYEIITINTDDDAFFNVAAMENLEAIESIFLDLISGVDLQDVQDRIKAIHQGLKGINEITSCLFDESNFYYTASRDNLKALHVNLIKLITRFYPIYKAEQC